MAISFIRVDDRMIHGQTCTRWALEYPCDGLIAVNDKAATTSVLKAAYKNASDKRPRLDAGRVAREMRQSAGQQGPVLPDYQGPDHHETDPGGRWL